MSCASTFWWAFGTARSRPLPELCPTPIKQKRAAAIDIAATRAGFALKKELPWKKLRPGLICCSVCIAPLPCENSWSTWAAPGWFQRPLDVGTANMLHLRCCPCQHGCILFFGVQLGAIAHRREPAKAHVADVNTLDIMRRRKMRRPKPYHHGNLRETLLEAAIRLIAEVGPTAFTLREVARRAGVSHNAPYRHFRDRDDLLAAVATQGYRELTVAMMTAAKPELSPRNRLKQAGLAYVSFALRRPEHFTVMFDAPSSQQQRPDAAEAAKLAFATLLGFVQQCQEKK